MKINFKKLNPLKFMKNNKKIKSSKSNKKNNKEKKLPDTIKVKSISRRMTISTTSILIVLILVLGITSYFISKEELIKSSNDLLLNKAVDSAGLVDEQIKTYTIAIETLGNMESISNPEIPLEQKYEVLMQDKVRLRLNRIGLADIEGKLLMDDGKTMDISETEYYERAKFGRTYFSEPMINEESGKSEVLIAAPLRYQGFHEGIIVAYKSADDFYNIASSIQIGENGFAYILNNNADVISHPTVTSSATTNNERGKSINFSDLKAIVASDYVDDAEAMYEKINNQESGVGKYLENGEIVHLGFAPIKSKGWTLVVSISESEVLAGLKTLKNTLISSIIIAVIIGIVFSLLFSRSITKPIAQATDLAFKISQLDLSKDVEEKLLSRKDELGRMANSLQVVIDNMRNFAMEIQESSHHVAASSEELAAISQESTAAATNIAENSNEIAENSNLQLEEIINVASSIKEISNQIDYMSVQTTNSENISKDVLDKTELGKEKIEEVITQMVNIEDSTQSVQSSLKNISTSSKDMNNMLEIIQNVAEETNLLALNAAIEAARAGEYGRGFAVVADEIRKLAEETQKSTEEINQIIKNNNILIKEANEKMDFSHKEVETGVIRVNETKETFEDIASIIKQITESINEVVSAVQNVENHVESVVNSSISIENMSKEIAAQIQNSSAASEEQMASMEEITSSTESLAKLAEDLQLLIGNIKF